MEARDKRTLKNAWQTAKNKCVTVEVLDTFLIEVFVLYSYDHKEEPPFLLGKDLQKSLNLPFDVKYRQLERVLGGKLAIFEESDDGKDLKGGVLDV